ncbi:membrane metalloprotease [Ulvibacter litoralis]|nr:membrane metalloprotease [Ulvibacter litoralis]
MKHFNRTFFSLLFVFLLVISCKKDDNTSSVEDLKAENRKALGVSAEDILSDDTYSSLSVELVYPEFSKPTDEAIANFRSFLEERLNKPGGITFTETQITSPTGTPYDIDEIKTIEDENRTLYTEGDDISVYIFFANGNSTNDTSTSVTLGTAYLNTSIVIYERTLQDFAANNPTINLIDLETVTLEHEFGHILGLVNIQGDDIHSDHEDPAHGKHCVVEECLMYFESNTNRPAAIVEYFSNQRRSVSGLDPLCIADLQAKGGK